MYMHMCPCAWLMDPDERRALVMSQKLNNHLQSHMRAVDGLWMRAALQGIEKDEEDARQKGGGGRTQLQATDPTGNMYHTAWPREPGSHDSRSPPSLSLWLPCSPRHSTFGMFAQMAYLLIAGFFSMCGRPWAGLRGGGPRSPGHRASARKSLNGPGWLERRV